MGSILPYTGGAYQSFYSDEHVSSFTHGPLASGTCDLNAANQMVERLNEGAKTIAPTISFNKETRCGSGAIGALFSTHRRGENVW